MNYPPYLLFWNKKCLIFPKKDKAGKTKIIFIIRPQRGSKNKKFQFRLSKR
jgi:hypothetical protein